MRTMSQQRLGPLTPVEQPWRMGKKRCYGQKRWGVNTLQSLFGLQLPLTHIILSIKWEVYFSKELCPLVFIELNMYSVKCIYVCIIGCEYTTQITYTQTRNRSIALWTEKYIPFWKEYFLIRDLFGLVWFYGISNFVGYLTPNTFSWK